MFTLSTDYRRFQAMAKLALSLTGAAISMMIALCESTDTTPMQNGCTVHVMAALGTAWWTGNLFAFFTPLIMQIFNQEVVRPLDGYANW
jgi:hypothetical protein